MYVHIFNTCVLINILPACLHRVTEPFLILSRMQGNFSVMTPYARLHLYTKKNKRMIKPKKIPTDRGLYDNA